MALITCQECGIEVSTSAKACPRCGAAGKTMRRQPRQPMSRHGKMIVAGLVAAFVIAAGIGVNRPAPSKTAEQAKEEKLEALRVNTAMGAMRALKASLRNPDSLTLDKISSTETGDVICIRYRAQNGFGGMNRDVFVLVDPNSYTSAAAWNRHCTHRTLYDYTETLPQMMKLVGQ